MRRPAPSLQTSGSTEVPGPPQVVAVALAFAVAGVAATAGVAASTGVAIGVAVAVVAPATIVGGYVGAWLVRRMPAAVLRVVIVTFGTAVGLLLLVRALT